MRPPNEGRIIKIMYLAQVSLMMLCLYRKPKRLVVSLSIMFCGTHERDASTSRTHFVNFAAFTASVTLNLAQGSSVVVNFAPIESAYVTFYWTSIVTLVIPCRISQILQSFCMPKAEFTIPSPIPAKIKRCSLWSKYVLGSAKSEQPRLTNHGIIFEDFQPM